MSETETVFKALLTDEEHVVIDDIGSLYSRISKSFADGKHKDADLAEIRFHVHAIQYAIMANAAARAFPDKYRLRGQAGAYEDDPGSRDT